MGNPRTLDRWSRRLKRAGVIVLPSAGSITLSKENLVMQGLWIGSSLSEIEKLSIRSFLANGHEFHLYVYGKCDGVPKGTSVKDANSILKHSEIPKYLNLAVASDMFRYLLLQKEEPRWWVDLDTVCLRPFDFPEDYVFASEHMQDGTLLVDNGILKVPKDSELIVQALERCGQQDKARPIGRFSHGGLAMGPELMTNLTEELNLRGYVKLPSIFTGIAPWLIPDAFTNPAFSKDFSAAYATHMWNSRWSTTGTDKNGSYHPKCLFEILKQRYSE